jgi:hypothetical protein
VTEIVERDLDRPWVSVISYDWAVCKADTDLRVSVEEKIGKFEKTSGILGVSPSRVSQILALANLSAPLQEGILLGQDHRSEVPLRAVANQALWVSQA